MDVLAGCDVAGRQPDRLAVLAHLGPGRQVDQRQLVPARHGLAHPQASAADVKLDAGFEIDARQPHGIGGVELDDGLRERDRHAASCTQACAGSR